MPGATFKELAKLQFGLILLTGLIASRMLLDGRGDR